MRCGRRFLCQGDAGRRRLQREAPCVPLLAVACRSPFACRNAGLRRTGLSVAGSAACNLSSQSSLPPAELSPPCRSASPPSLAVFRMRGSRARQSRQAGCGWPVCRKSSPGAGMYLSPALGMGASCGGPTSRRQRGRLSLSAVTPPVHRTAPTTSRHPTSCHSPSRHAAPHHSEARACRSAWDCCSPTPWRGGYRVFCNDLPEPAGAGTALATCVMRSGAPSWQEPSGTPLHRREAGCQEAGFPEIVACGEAQSFAKGRTVTGGRTQDAGFSLSTKPATIPLRRRR